MKLIQCLLVILFQKRFVSWYLSWKLCEGASNMLENHIVEVTLKHHIPDAFVIQIRPILVLLRTSDDSLFCIFYAEQRMPTFFFKQYT